MRRLLATAALCFALSGWSLKESTALWCYPLEVR